MENLEYKEFIAPPPAYRSRPLWFWNSEGRALAGITQEGIREIMEHCVRDSGYAGFGILPEWLDGYMSEPYFDLYRCALETARELRIKMCLYDENGFPSGSAGGLLAKNHPEDTMKRLDKEEKEITGPCRAELLLRAGDGDRFLGAVLFQTDIKEITDISACFVQDGSRYLASLDIPAGTFKIMIFIVRKDGYDRVDYLDKKAVEHLIAITHETYYARFQEYFGTVIDSAFYDEPMLYQAQGRTWTGDFNILFEKKYGYDPITLYPALWYDIGGKTASARNALFGFRTELFSENYIKTMNDWCRSHGIALTGHMDQEENVNPVTTCGDLMKIFQYQDIPGIDEISFYDRARKAYKIISSAAYNWDKPLVMTEVYGAMGEEIDASVLYKDIMNQFVRGINYVVPHAVWYDSRRGVTFPPELSYRSAKYAAELPSYNLFTARAGMLLQGGCHAADIGILYPIDSLQAETRFDCGDPYSGSVPAGADYMDLGDFLVTEARLDYTFLHPETILQKCTVENGKLLLHNAVNSETYRVLILPGGNTVSCGVLQKVKAFCDSGGKVIFTSLLPTHSSEEGRDGEVCEIIRDILHRKNKNAESAVFIPQGEYARLAAVLNEFLKVPDVAAPYGTDLPGGSFGCLHKIKYGRNLYYFANSSDTEVSCPVTVRGKISAPCFWDPHTGARSAAPCSYGEESRIAVTRFDLKLQAVRSVFLIENG